MGRPRQATLGVRLAASLILLLFAAWAGRQALGDFLQLAPANTIDRILASTQPLRAPELTQARAELVRAASVDPRNPYAWEYLAQSSLLAARLPQANVSSVLLEAADEYHRAIGLRPNSGYLQAGEMTALYLLSRRQPLTEPQARRLRVAMIAAVRMAPWERQVLSQVLDVALGEGSNLNPGQRAALQVAAQHLMLLGSVAH